MSNAKKQTPQIIDNYLYESLIDENNRLREKLREVSAVGISVMFHTHRDDCSHFTRDFLKAIVMISNEIKVQEVQTIYQDAYELASEPGVIEQFQTTRFHQEKS